jgi:hypothetical protein
VPERKRLFTKRTTDPRWLLKLNLRIISTALDQLGAKGKDYRKAKLKRDIARHRKDDVEEERQTKIMERTSYRTDDYTKMLQMHVALTKSATKAMEEEEAIADALKEVTDEELQLELKKKRKREAGLKGQDNKLLEETLDIQTRMQTREK